MTQEATKAIVLSPREVATGSPAGAALENINTHVLGDGALCYVSSGAGQGEWQLQKSATDVPDGVTIVEPISGPGRWFIKLLPGAGGGGGSGTVTGVLATARGAANPETINVVASPTTPTVNLQNIQLGTTKVVLGVGTPALALVSTESIAIGSGAMGAASLGAFSGNIALGHNAMANAGPAPTLANIAIGTFAMSGGAIQSNNNVAVGYFALNQLDSGNGSNIALGFGALGALLTGDTNVGIGGSAGSAMTAGQGNIFIGEVAGSVAQGSGNVLLGRGAGQSMVVGDLNTFVGISTGAALAALGGSNNVLVGALVDVPLDNTSNYASFANVLTSSDITGPVALRTDALTNFDGAAVGDVLSKGAGGALEYVTPGAGATSLQAAYDGGNAIVLSGPSGGPIQINANGYGGPVLQLQDSATGASFQFGAGVGVLLAPANNENVQLSANGTGYVRFSGPTVTWSCGAFEGQAGSYTFDTVGGGAASFDNNTIFTIAGVGAGSFIVNGKAFVDFVPSGTAGLFRANGWRDVLLSGAAAGGGSFTFSGYKSYTAIGDATGGTGANLNFQNVDSVTFQALVSSGSFDINNFNHLNAIVDGNVTLNAFTGIMTLGASSLVLNGGADPMIWPAGNGVAGSVLANDGAGNLSFTTILPNFRYVTFYLGNAGASGAALNVDFTTLGQKITTTLTANTALTFTFPGVGNYTLELVQDGTGGWIPTLPASVYTTGGQLSLGGDPGDVSIWSIFWNGTNAVISSVPKVVSPTTVVLV